MSSAKVHVHDEAKPMTRQAYLAKVHALQHSLIKEVKKSERAQKARVFIQTKMTKFESWMLRADKYMFYLLIITLSTIVIWVIVRIIKIKHKYAFMIKTINDTKVGLPTLLPVMISPGMNVAIACEYPILTQWLGYVNKGFPYACYISVYSKSLRDAFLKNPAGYLQVMFAFQEFGHNDVRAGSTTSSLAIVCSSWGLQAKLKDCMDPCPPSNKSDLLDYVTSGATTAATGAQMGGMIGPEGAAVGAVIGAVIGIGLTAFKSHATKKSAYCY